MSMLFFHSKTFADSGNIKMLYESAVDAYNKQQYDAAIDYYNQIIVQAPNFAPAYNGLGLTIRAKDEDYDEAIKYFNLAIKSDPRFTESFENLGRMYYAKGDYNQAQHYFEKTLAIDPNATNSLLSIGWIYLLAKANPPKAIKYFEKAFAQSQDPNIYFALGMAYFSNNERIKAIEVVTKLRSIGQEDLALKLERAMREARAVNVNPPQEKKQAADKTVQPPVNQDNTQDVKVRLRGKLEDLNPSN